MFYQRSVEGRKFNLSIYSSSIKSGSRSSNPKSQPHDDNALRRVSFDSFFQI